MSPDIPHLIVEAIAMIAVYFALNAGLDLRAMAVWKRIAILFVAFFAINLLLDLVWPVASEA